MDPCSLDAAIAADSACFESYRTSTILQKGKPRGERTTAGLDHGGNRVGPERTGAHPSVQIRVLLAALLLTEEASHG
jgi:hypothetical protein